MLLSIEIIKFIKTTAQLFQLEMESMFCFVCGGKNNPTSSRCHHCGEKLTRNPTDLTKEERLKSKQLTKEERLKSIQLTKEERSILEELGELQHSSLGGRIIHLFKKLNELPNLSQESIGKIRAFTNHKNEDVKKFSIRISSSINRLTMKRTSP